RVVTAVRLPRSLHRRLRHAATERDVSVNFLVTRAVGDLLDHLPPPGEALAPSSTGTPSSPDAANATDTPNEGAAR
ncbi:MAG: toxin-antitoxin system HicB family antitoxin, partial [Acidimicrobiia bacterium]|nr:toxin-antitoxin system HicB family antitoxin [Acidimicrobiia bacterium]